MEDMEVIDGLAYFKKLPAGAKPSKLMKHINGYQYHGYFTAFPAKGRFLGRCVINERSGIDREVLFTLPHYAPCLTLSVMYLAQLFVTIYWLDGSGDAPLKTKVSHSSLLLAINYFVGQGD